MTDMRDMRDKSPTDGRGSGGPPVPRGNRPPGPSRSWFQMSGRTWLILLGFALLFYAYFYIKGLEGSSPSTGPTIPLNVSGSNSFYGAINKNLIATAVLDRTNSKYTGAFRDPYLFKGKAYTNYTVTIDPSMFSRANDIITKHTAIVLTAKPSGSSVWLTVLSLLLNTLPILFIIGLIFFGTRMARQQSQGVFGFGQGRGKLYTEDRPSTTFADVAGVDGAKNELAEVVDFLRQPAKYHKLGARIPKGVLLVGAPGTGKTLLARAVAGEANVPFLAMSATEFVELFVGVGASRVRDLFTRAKAVAPSILFIDEIDAIGGSRGARSPMSGGGNDEREQTLNQMLVSMDGFEPNEAVIILAATNRPDVLDPALLRPGRFDREVMVDPPDRKGREAILKIHTRKLPLGRDVHLEKIARMTPGMSGADLSNLANEAALTAARKDRVEVTESDFVFALDRVTLGLEGSPLMNELERRTVAYHEAGHALVAAMLPNVDPVTRITITPRGRSLGVTQFVPDIERRNYPREFLVNRMAVGMGGRAAEEVVFDDITSGAQNDLQTVTNMARAMVTQLGMADEVGPTYLGSASDDALGGRYYNPFETKDYSDETARSIDLAIRKFVDSAHELALQLLRDNREALDAVADALLQDESLDRDSFLAVIEQHLPPGHHLLPGADGERILVDDQGGHLSEPALDPA